MYNYNHKSNKKASKQTNKQFQHKVRIGSSLQQLVLLLPGLWEETVGSSLCSPWLTVSAQHRVSIATITQLIYPASCVIPGT